jgi:hypothetical protein
MPTYSITGPDGKTYSIDGPAGADRDQVVAAIQNQQAIQAEQQKLHETKTGFMPALKAAGRSALGAVEETLGFDKAAEEQRQKAAAIFEPTTEEDIARAKEKGIFPTAGAYLSQKITEPLGGIVGRYGVPTAASLVAPEAAIAGLGARALTFGATDLPASMGESIQAQREAGQDVDRTKAFAAGLAKTAIATVGMPGVGRISNALGPKVLAEAEALAPRVQAGVITEQQALAQLSGRAKSYAQSMLANTVAGTGLMAGTEAIERFQTGRPQMTAEELGQTVETAGLLSPIFGALHPTGRAEARGVLSEAAKVRETEVNNILTKQSQLASLDDRAKAQRILVDEAAYQTVLDRIHSEPNRPVQEIIDEMTGVTKPEEIRKTQADVEAALNEPSGQYVNDPVTQQERQLTVGELQKVQRPELFPEEPANIITDKTLTDLGIKKSTPLIKKGGLRDLDLNKPEEAQQVIDGLSLFKEQKGIDPTTKLKIEDKIKEIEVKQKEAEDARLRAERDRTDIQAPREPGVGETTERTAELERARNAELPTDTGPATMGEAGRGVTLKPAEAPVTTEVLKGETKYAKEEPVRTQETPETILEALRGRFGKNIDKAIERKEVKLIESKDIPADKDPNAVAYFDKGVAHLITDRLSKEDAPRKILHEVGVHYGLEGMMGKALYRDILRTVNRLKDTDAAVKAAHDHVNGRYKELVSGSNEHLEEVLARLGESAPNHNLWRRMVAAIKDFLFKKGLWNVNKMDVHDIHDLINRSTAKSLAGEVKPTIEQPLKNTKIVDEEGSPLEVYHGTNTAKSTQEFLNSMQRKEARGEAIYFTPSKEWAKNFGKSVHSSYLDIKKPFITDNFQIATSLLEKAKVAMGGRADSNVWSINGPTIDRLIKQGYDGIIYKTKDPKKGDYHMVFDSKQIVPAEKAIPAVKYAKAELPISERFKDTSVLSPPGDNIERSAKEFVTDSYDQFKTEAGRKQIKDSASRAFLDGRIKVAYAGAGVQSKLIKDFNGAVLDATKGIRADILYDQALNGNILGSTSAKQGKVIFDESNVAKVVDSPDHISAIFDEQAKLAKRIGAADAKHVSSAYLQALRYQEILENNKKYEALIKQAKDQKLKDSYKKEIKFVSDEQRAAADIAIKYADEFPEVKKMAEIYDKVNKDQIDLLEKAGIYSKDYADKLRNTKGYVPMYRVMDDLESFNPGVRQHFKGLVDIGKEHAFEGSERQTVDVLDNMLTRHMWAINAAVRNNANKQLMKQLAVHGEDGKPIVYDFMPAGKEDVMTPIWIEGKRKFVEYTDPHFAQAVYGLEPSLGPILGLMGKASTALRIGVTANPFFQTYQLFNDAPRAAILSGVDHPFKLMGEVFSSFYKTIKDPNDPIIKEMNRLGISGGFGHNAKDIAEKMRRDLGLEANTLTKRALDKTESFAAASDMAQRRALFKRTLLETGGVEQADGNIIGGNKVLAMDRAMNIIHWQKHGTSNKLRVLTQVVPFLNAYIQGMDTLIRAARGEGISGLEKKQAQVLFVQTALKIAALSTIYSMAVGGDEEYQQLDDRQKIRSFIIPGTGIKIPVASEVAMLTKAIPEMTWQYINRQGTENPMDSTKLMSAIGGSFADGLLGPNLMPQAFRAGVEVITNHDFLTGHPVVGRGMETLATSDQFTENTSELSKLIGKTGIISPLNLDHLIRGYGGTMASSVLFGIDATANMFYNDKLPSTPLYKIPMVSSFMYSPEGKGMLNDYYDLKNKSDEVAATLNHRKKFGTPEEALEYRQDNAEMISVRNQVNNISNRLKILRDRRKHIIVSDLSADEKRAQIDEIDSRINNMVQNIGALRVKAGL